MYHYGKQKSRNQSMNADKPMTAKVDVGMSKPKKAAQPAAGSKSKMKSPKGFQGGLMSHQV